MSTKIFVPRNATMADLMFVLQNPEEYEFSSYDVKMREKQIKSHLEKTNFIAEHKSEILNNLERIVSTVR